MDPDWTFFVQPFQIHTPRTDTTKTAREGYLGIYESDCDDSKWV